MFGLMRVSEHRRLMTEQREWWRKLGIEAWAITLRMSKEVRGAQKGLMRLQRKLKRVDWERGRYPGKITQHWLRAAFERIAAGEPEREVLLDYGYVAEAPAWKHLAAQKEG